MSVFGGEVLWEVVCAHIDFLLPIVVLSALKSILVVSVGETVILSLMLLIRPSCLENAWGRDSPSFLPNHSHIATLPVQVCTTDWLIFLLVTVVIFLFCSHCDLMLDGGFVVRRVVLDCLLLMVMMIVGTYSSWIYVNISATFGSCLKFPAMLTAV